MSVTILRKDQLEHSTIGSIAQLKENEWVEPESNQRTYLKDFRRFNLEIQHETEATRGETVDVSLEARLDGSLMRYGFSPDEIERLKRHYSQNLVSINTAAIIEALTIKGHIVAQEADSDANRRILIKKNQHGEVIAETEYWGFQVYKEGQAGYVDDRAGVTLLPGKVKSVFILTPTGFRLSHMEASNSYLARLIMGEEINESVEEMAFHAVEEEHETALEDLEAAEHLIIGNDELTHEVRELRAEVRYSRKVLNQNDPTYVERVNEVNQAATVTTAALRAPYHTPTLNRLGRYAEVFPNRQHPRLKWALIGIFGLLVTGACVTATVMSFGVLAAPSFIAAKVATAAATKAISTVLNAGGLATSGFSAYKLWRNTRRKVSQRLRNIRQNIGFFDHSAARRKEKAEDDQLRQSMASAGRLSDPLLTEI